LPKENHAVQAHQFRSISIDDMEEEFRAPGILVPQNTLEDSGWRFEDHIIARLRQKIKDKGFPLKQYCGSPICGIKTGLNEAFIIDNKTHDELIASDPKSTEILKPYYGGKDLQPWRAHWRGLWLIRIPAGWTNDAAKKHFSSEKEAFSFFRKQYPAVADWLASYEKAARKRCDKGDWYWELRSCAYYDEFEKPKIMYPDIANRPKFVYDDKGFYLDMTIFFIPGNKRYLQGILCSSLFWWYFKGISSELRGGRWRYRLKTEYMEEIPIAQPNMIEEKKISLLVEALSSEKCSNRLELEGELNDRVAVLYGLTPEEKKIIEQAYPPAHGE
jgi:hypothetical protein